MTAKKNILAICGSTRENSANKDIIEIITKLGQEQFTITNFDISTLPHFNQDLSNENVPTSVIEFREAISKADSVLICTPEYVFSLPGILKNAIEWTVSTTIFSDKTTALITASSSGEKAHESLLLVMNTLGIKTNTDLCLLISGVKSKLNMQGEVIDPVLNEQLQRLVATIADSEKNLYL
ncbi:MAG: NADPH-dependent FMN reductase [Bacteroidota bacterium]